MGDLAAIDGDLQLGFGGRGCALLNPAGSAAEELEAESLAVVLREAAAPAVTGVEHAGGWAIDAEAAVVVDGPVTRDVERPHVGGTDLGEGRLLKSALAAIKAEVFTRDLTMTEAVE